MRGLCSQYTLRMYAGSRDAPDCDSTNSNTNGTPMTTRLLLSLLLAFFMAAPASAAPPKDKNKRPSLDAQTKTRQRDNKNQTESSILASIENQKMVLDLEDKNSKSYPANVIALADFYWDYAENYGMRAYSEEVEKPLFEAEEAKRTGEVKRLKALQASYLAKKKQYQEKTIDTYKQVIRKYPRSGKLDEIRYFLAYNLVDMGRAEEGVETYTQLVGSHPKSPFVPDALVNIGEYYFERNDFENALRLYQEAQKKSPKSGIVGYAMYKQAWCHYNLQNYKVSLSQFIDVIAVAEKAKKQKAQGAIALKKEAQNDMVLPYSKDGKASKAIAFLKKYAPDRYLALAGRLATVYSEQSEYNRSNKLLRDLIVEAKKGPINGKDQSYLTVRFQRQIVDNAQSSGDKDSTVTEIGELVRIYQDVKHSAPKAFIKDEAPMLKQLILDVAVDYHKEYEKTKNLATLSKTQQLYDLYLRVFRDDDGAYQISWNNALLMLATEKYPEAAAEFENVIAMKPNGEYADPAAERAVLAYLEVVKNDPALNKTRDKSEDDEDLTKVDLTPSQQRFVTAIDRWMTLVKKNGPTKETAENIPVARFAAARIYYNANHFDESGKRFVEFIDNHASHELYVEGADLALRSFNLGRDVDNLRTYANRFEKDRKLMATHLAKEIQVVRNTFNFQECFKYEKENPLKSAQCFEQYARDFSEDKDRAAKAQYNAGLNYFEAKQVEKAIEMQLKFYEDYRGDKLAPKALYSLGEMFRQTTVYDSAAQVYETFFENHPKHKLAEKALRFASIYRKTLGEYKAAVKNLKTYLKRFPGHEAAPRVHLDIIKILAKQDKDKAVIKEVKRHLKRYKRESPSTRLQVLNIRGKAFQGDRKFRDSRKAFQDTVAYFKTLAEKDLQDLTMPAISAVAESHFNIGETSLRKAKKIKLDSGSGKKMKKALTAKLSEMTKTKTVYEQVIAYNHPGWMIAASTQLGSAYQNLADAVENAPIPRKIRHLDEVVEQYLQDMSERAKNIRSRAVASYKQALDVAKRERWFNEYSERAETAIAQLDLTDLSIKEFRVRPDHLRPNVGHPIFKGGDDDALKAVVTELADPNVFSSDIAGALSKLSSIAQKNPKNADAQYNVGLAKLIKGDYTGAAASWNKALQVNAGHLASQAQLAGLQIRRGQTDAAIAKLEAIIKKDRFQAEARNLLSAYEIGKKNYKGAIKHSRNALLGDRENVNTLLNVAIAYYEQELYDQAGLIAESTLKKVPTAASLENVLGLVFLRRDDSRSATDHFSKALKLNPANRDARLNLAALELAYGNFESALPRLEQEIEVDPRNHVLVASRGVALRGLKKFDEAAQAYKAAQKLQPRYSEADYNMCIMHHQFTSDWKAAKVHCSKYLQALSKGDAKYKEVSKRVSAIEATLKALEPEPAAPGGAGEDGGTP